MDIHHKKYPKTRITGSSGMELFNSAAESLTIFGRQLNIYCAREKEKEDGAFCHDHSTHTLDAGFTA